MTPTDEQLKARKITREDYDIRNALWHKMLGQMEPDERDRINAEPTGFHAMSLAMTVEVVLEQMKINAAKEGITITAEAIKASTENLRNFVDPLHGHDSDPLRNYTPMTRGGPC